MASIDPPRHGEGDHAKRGGGGTPQVRRPEVITARKLRKEMSYPEVLLWQRLRGQTIGAKFRRQHPIGPYIADFYCRAALLVIEIDGQVHDNADRAGNDMLRDAFLEENGYKVLRVSAAEVLRDADGVAVMIADVVLASIPLHHPADGPPPRAGEER